MRCGREGRVGVWFSLFIYKLIRGVDNRTFIHKNNRLVDISNMDICDYSYNLIEEDNEINLTKKILQHKNIKVDNYESFVKKLSEITVTKGFMK